MGGLFADDGTDTRLPMTALTGDIWHAYVPGVGAGVCDRPGPLSGPHSCPIDSD